MTIAIGYLVGEINIKGFSLGVGAMLFVALGMGWFAPEAVPAPMVGTLGLALFLYAVGVQYGKQFFIGLVSPAGAPGQHDGHDRRREQARADRPAGPRLRHDLSGHDHREDIVCGHCCGAIVTRAPARLAVAPAYVPLTE